MVHLIVTVTCAHWAPDLRRARDSTGGRAHLYRGDNTAEQIVAVPQIQEHNVEVIKVVLQEQCQQMRFFFGKRVGRELWAAREERAAPVLVDFFLTACGEGGGCGQHVPHVHNPEPGSQGISSASPARAFMSVSIASMSTLVGSERVIICCCSLVHSFLPLFPCVFTFFASSIACTLSGVKYQCNGN